MPRLFLADGYTIEAATSEKYGELAGLPVVKFAYRPAMTDAIYEWRWKTQNAASGKDRLDAAAKLVADHLVTWDVAGDAGTTPITVDIVRRIPEPIFEQILGAVLTWAPKNEAKAAGN